MDEFKISSADYDTLSVLHNQGPAGITAEGKFTDASIRFLNYIARCEPATREVLSLFMQGAAGKITDSRAEEIYAIYNCDYSQSQAYEKLFEFYMGQITNSNDDANLWWKATSIDEAFTYFRVRSEIYNHSDAELLAKIDSASDELIKTLNDKGLSNKELGDYGKSIGDSIDKYISELKATSE